MLPSAVTVTDSRDSTNFEPQTPHPERGAGRYSQPLLLELLEAGVFRPKRRKTQVLTAVKTKISIMVCRRSATRTGRFGNETNRRVGDDASRRIGNRSRDGAGHFLGRRK